MKFKGKTEGDVLIMSLSGKIMGGPDFEKFHEQVKNMVAEGHRKFLFDMTGATWLNSTGMGIMVSAHISITGAEGRLVICGANKRIKGIYYVSQLDKVFETFDTVAEGMAALAAD